jgi:hypothetical protein
MISSGDRQAPLNQTFIKLFPQNSAADEATPTAEPTVPLARSFAFETLLVE